MPCQVALVRAEVCVRIRLLVTLDTYVTSDPEEGSSPECDLEEGFNARAWGLTVVETEGYLEGCLGVGGYG